jgi:hypothetical protein
MIPLKGCFWALFKGRTPCTQGLLPQKGYWKFALQKRTKAAQQRVPRGLYAVPEFEKEAA